MVWTNSRAEKQVEKRLVQLGFDAWLPIISVRRRWTDRWRDVETPLFPGYLFARGNVAEWHVVLRTRGVLTVVKSEGRPAMVSDRLVRDLCDAIARGGDAVQPLPEPAAYEVGEEVIVQDGPLRGLRGVVRELRGSRRLVIWVSVIGRGIAVSIGSAAVTPVH